MLWDEAKVRSLVRDGYPSLWGLFQRYPEWIQRADACRYMILHRHGGIYADLDVICRRPFDRWLDRKIVLPPTEPFGFSNDLMLAEQAHGFTGQLISRLATAYARWQHWYVPRHFRVLLTTGSLFVSLEYRRYRARNEITIMDPVDYGAGASPEAYVEHVLGNSWHGRDSQAWVALQRGWRALWRRAPTLIAGAALWQ